MLLSCKVLYVLAVVFCGRAVAEVTCLRWLGISLYASAICYFAPETFETIENATIGVFHSVEKEAIQTVETAIDDAENLVKFDVTHAPVTVAFELASQALGGKSSTSGAYLNEISMDYVNLSIGFTKEAVNQGVTLVNLLGLFDWSDTALCVVKDAVKLATADQRRRKERGLKARSPADSIDEAAGEGVVQKCVANKFQGLAAQTYNITDPNQKIGATISDLAGLFVPVPAVAIDGVADVATGAVDLAILENESTSRILKKTATGTEHFADEEEAMLVKENIQDDAWAKENCVAEAACQVASGAAVQVARRGECMNFKDIRLACRLALPSEYVVPPSENYAMVRSWRAALKFDKKYFTETDMVPWPSLPVHNFDDTEGIIKDLLEVESVQVAFSPKVQAIATQEEIFQLLHSIFDDPDGELYKRLVPSPSKDPTKVSITIASIPTDLPKLKRIREFMEEGCKDLAQIGGRTGTSLRGGYKVTRHIFYYPKSGSSGYPEAILPLHSDASILTSIASDVNGLVLANSRKLTVSRPPVVADGRIIFKGEQYLAEIPGGHYLAPTYHGVWGGDMATKNKITVAHIVYRDYL